MESIRQKKVASLIQNELGQIFTKGIWNALGNIMITVTRVSVTKDLAIAKVYVSLFPAKNPEESYHIIHKASSEIRYHLAGRIGKQVRTVPELHFILDDSLDYIENIERLLNNG
jgi:ribosome-binding factor A